MRYLTTETLVTAPLLAIALATTPAAFAAPVIENGDTRSVAVSYADLNLREQAGVNTLSRRIKQAAYRVCGVASGQDLLTYMSAHKCFKASMTRAMRSVDLAVLQARGEVQIAANSASGSNIRIDR